MHLVFKKKQKQKIKDSPLNGREERVLCRESQYKNQDCSSLTLSYTKFARIFSFAVSLQSSDQQCKLVPEVIEAVKIRCWGTEAVKRTWV